MQIGTCKSKPGKLTNGELPLCKYKNLYLKIPIFIAEGEAPGKTIFISAGTHGDEVNGIEILYHFMYALNLHKLVGTIIFLPLTNPWGFKENSRYIPFDNRDLNRSFDKKGSSISYKIADSLMKNVIEKCDFGIDLHDGRTNVLLPHPRIFKKDESEFMRELSHVFGTEIILEREGESGMLAVESFKRYKIPVLTIEVGGAKVIRNDFRNQAVGGLKNILIYTNMLNGILSLPVKQFILEQREGYISPTKGILYLEVKLGDAVKKNQVIARIHNPISNKKFIVRSRNPGVVFSIRREAIINKKESILSILHFKISKRKELIPVQAKMLINRTKPEEIITRPTIILDNILSLLGLSYKFIDESLRASFEKIDEYFSLRKSKH
ncbi:succinylglutamate desuccinylase/aspartoacylase family protein [Candidatus Woesearchaeota archaeon]|nr:succinylglutamate desuccinylase/aspartoacylase family protein [Candidatus Woesearchaeota archaeon]